MTDAWAAALAEIEDPRRRRAVRALVDVDQHHLGDFDRARGPVPAVLAPEDRRWEVQVEVTHERDVVSYLVDAADAVTARQQIAARSEVECVHEVIHVFGRADP